MWGHLSSRSEQPCGGPRGDAGGVPWGAGGVPGRAPRLRADGAAQWYRAGTAGSAGGSRPWQPSWLRTKATEERLGGEMMSAVSEPGFQHGRAQRSLARCQGVIRAGVGFVS